LYSRSFYPPEGAVTALPESYDGTRFSENTTPEAPKAAVEEATEVSAMPTAGEAKQASSLFPNLFGGGVIFGAGGFLSDIGIEEILIIAVAAFLFLSNDGDIECAIMLVLLLFIAK
jgi:hypothetical protein